MSHYRTIHRKILIMNTLNILSAILIISIGTSCNSGLSYFTKDLYDRYDWSERELKRIQFYLSEDITLKRQLGNNQSRIVDGKIEARDGKKIEEIRIPKGTPGVFISSPNGDQVKIAFESGKDEKSLVFGPNPHFNDRYTLLLFDRNGGGGKVHYGGKVYRVAFENRSAGIKVDLKKVSDTSVRSRTAKGRRVN